ncbi:DUF5333 domain-containing protein [Pseudoroseicyclus sp. CXY001]|uniref:DUF5333 domain-containing protein n=1 Tax=Pseudoroseicyclus sp. CXY001 TaxID=3242492 RepID=UPI00358DCB8E
MPTRPHKTPRGRSRLGKPFAAATGLILGFSILAGASAAKPALGSVNEITDGLIDIAIAYEISEVCGPIDARLLRGISALNGLKSQASALGYTDEEIEAFVRDRGEKARLEALARERLAALGATRGDEESHCAVGRQQMAEGTAIGRLLR